MTSFHDPNIPHDEAMVRPLHIDGRTYAADNAYLLPIDAQDAIERQNFQHYVLRQMINAFYIAPVANPRNAQILDVGTGPGKWPLEVARHFPLTKVVGIDINPSPPQGALPANYTFMLGSVLDRLPCHDETFDLTHQRLLNFAIPADQWMSHVIGELGRVTKIGGWIELMEWGGYLHQPGPALGQLVELVRTASLRRNINLYAGAHLHEILARGRCTNINWRILWVPVGKHGGRIGQMMQVDSLALIEGVRSPMAKLGLATIEQIDDLLEQAKFQLEVWECFMPFYIAYGQRV